MRPPFSWALAASAALAFCPSAPMGSFQHSSSEAAFPGYNGKIAFSSAPPGGILDIYTMNPDGTGVTNITNSPLINEEYPSWSPDGTKIAFDTFEGDIFVISPDGSGRTNLTDPSATPGFQPKWSPDGSKIAYLCHPPSASPGGNPGEICVMNADGSGQTVLTNNTWIDAFPAWSPDGTKIAFATNERGPGEISVMDPDGSNQVNLTNSLAYDREPAWSPDGLSIAFVTAGDGIAQIFLMNSDGSGQRNLSNNPQHVELGPEWSPDGAFIVFSSTRNGSDDITVMQANGSEQRTLCRADGFQGEPSWQPWTSPATPIAGEACPAGLQIPTTTPSPFSPNPPAPIDPVPATPSPIVGALPNTGGRQPAADALTTGILLIASAVSLTCLAGGLALSRRKNHEL